MANYQCAKLAERSDIHGEYACEEWVEVPNQPSLLPELTVEEANELGLAIIYCLLFAFGWKQLQRAF